MRITTMVKLDKLPHQSIIDGLKGTLDYYVIHLNPTMSEGINVCRSWPRYNPENRTAASLATAMIFAYISKLSRLLPDNLIQAYTDQAAPTRLTWKDLLLRSYIKGENVYPNSTTLDDWWNEDD